MEKLKEYRYHSVTIKTWKMADAGTHPYPWRFSIQKDGEDEQIFCGIPNLCENRHSAYMRGLHRAKWKVQGIWSKHYKKPGP